MGQSQVAKCVTGQVQVQRQDDRSVVTSEQFVVRLVRYCFHRCCWHVVPDENPVTVAGRLIVLVEILVLFVCFQFIRRQKCSWLFNILRVEPGLKLLAQLFQLRLRDRFLYVLTQVCESAVNSVVEVAKDHIQISSAIQVQILKRRWLQLELSQELSDHFVPLVAVLCPMLQVTADKVEHALAEHEAVRDATFVPDHPKLAFSLVCFDNARYFSPQFFLAEDGDDHLPHATVCVDVDEAMLLQVSCKFSDSVALVVFLRFLERHSDDVRVLGIGNQRMWLV